MKHAFIDRYAHLKSPIHELDVAKKLAAALSGLFLLLILLPLLDQTRTMSGLYIYSICALLVALGSKVPISFLLTRSVMVLPFSALIILVNFVSGNFSPGQTLEMILKSMLSIFTLLLLTSTTPFHELMKQLARWGAPRLFIIILAFMYRYFFLLVGEIEALERGIKMRHSQVGGWKRTQVYASIIGMLLIRSYERAENVYRAMRMRGFTGDFR